MAQTLETGPSRPGTIYFELERLDRSAPGRLELTGRWFGVRGRRFVRPTLTFELDGHPHRLLADLEHKPWHAEDGGQWVAAFPWDGDGAPLQSLELTVAPDIAIPLSEKPGRGERSRSARRPPERDRSTALRRELQSARDELAAERRSGERLLAELEPLRAEVQALREEVEQLREEKVERDAAMARRNAALAKLSAVEARLDEERDAREQSETEHDELRRVARQAEAARDRALSAAERLQRELAFAAEVREGALAERESAIRARDRAQLERDRALAERDQFAHAGDSLQAQRAAARALVSRRNLAWRGSAWTGRGSRANPDILRREISWPARIVAATLLVVVVLLILIGTGVI